MGLKRTRQDFASVYVAQVKDGKTVQNGRMHKGRKSVTRTSAYQKWVAGVGKMPRGGRGTWRTVDLKEGLKVLLGMSAPQQERPGDNVPRALAPWQLELEKRKGIYRKCSRNCGNGSLGCQGWKVYMTCPRMA